MRAGFSARSLSALYIRRTLQREVKTNSNVVACAASSYLLRAHTAATTTTTRRQQSTCTVAVDSAYDSSSTSYSRNRAAANNARYRPKSANGKAIAFHIKDLYKSQAALATEDSLYEEVYEETVEAVAAKKEYESDLVVVLDMDECLIHSQFLSSPQTAQVYAHQLQQQRRQSTKSGSKVVDHFKITLPEGDLVHVNLRPGLHEFLKDCTSRFETHIFTAASSIYAKPVLDQLDPDNNMFAGRWYREHCTYQERPQRAYIKNLEALPLGRDLSRVVLVDNNPLSFQSHPKNGILVSSFYTDPHDTSLRTVWKLLQKLDDHKEDVRPILEEKFNLEEALKKMAAQKIAQQSHLSF